MDLNRLFFDHQLALMRSAAAESARERCMHGRAADELASRISAFQRQHGALAAPMLPAYSL